MYILLIFWYGSFAAQIQRIDGLTSKQCINMQVQIDSRSEETLPGNVRTMCIKKETKWKLELKN